MRPADVPRRVQHARDRAQRAVWVGGVIGSGLRARGVHVAEQDLALALERVERRVVGVEAALTVGDRHAQRPAGVDQVRERRVAPFRGDHDLLPGEPQRRVAQQGARHEPGLGQDLEAVADAQDEAATGREVGDGPHDRAEAGDHTGPHVVAVREPAGQDDRRDAIERGVLVPQDDRLGPGQLERVDGVAVAVAAGEDDDPDADRHLSPPPPRRRRPTMRRRSSRSRRPR